MSTSNVVGEALVMVPRERWQNLTFAVADVLAAQQRFEASIDVNYSGDYDGLLHAALERLRIAAQGS